MDRAEIDEILARTLDDRRVSRGEQKALREAIEDLRPDRREIAEIRSRAFDLAREAIRDEPNRAVATWLEEIVRVLSLKESKGGGPGHSEAVFSPGDACLHRIVGLLNGARESVDICVYTITDDLIATAVENARSRGVRIRLLTDDEKAADLGSDIRRLEQAGVAVATDRSEYQMHHKFAIFDGTTLLTGSYNWTRAAREQNQENLVVVDDLRLVGAFSSEFEKLWERFRKN